MRISLPERTALEIELPGGSRVWVQTLNSREMSDAQQYAQIEAARVVSKIRECTEETIRAELATANEDALCAILSAPHVREWEIALINAHPYPVEPEPVDLDKPGASDAWLAKVAAYDEETASIEASRELYRDVKRKALMVEWANTPEPARITRLSQASLAAALAARFEMFFAEALIYHATRLTGDHTQHVFDGPQEVATVSDDVRDALLEAYNRADGVTSEAVPTSPAA